MLRCEVVRCRDRLVGPADQASARPFPGSQRRDRNRLFTSFTSRGPPSPHLRRQFQSLTTTLVLTRAAHNDGPIFTPPLPLAPALSPQTNHAPHDSLVTARSKRARRRRGTRPAFAPSARCKRPASAFPGTRARAPRAARETGDRGNERPPGVIAVDRTR